jgi:hypothetical protein
MDHKKAIILPKMDHKRIYQESEDYQQSTNC